MNEIKTSVIIPVYNTEQYLETCLESVLLQTQQEIEIILVDDGSTDGSRQIIEKYKKKYSFIKTIHQENQKQGAARNAGVKISSGKYIYFLDSDDYIEEDLFEKCYHIAERDRLDFLMFDAETFADEEDKNLRKEMFGMYIRQEIGIEDKIYSGEEFWNEYYQRNGIRVNAYLVYINAEFLKKNNLLFEPEIFYEDSDWMLRMYMYAQRVAYYPQILYYRRIRSGSTMTEKYQIIHLRSAIIECEKILQMLLEEGGASKRRMIYLHVKNIFCFFEGVFAGYYKENQLEDVLDDILGFYGYIIERYSRIIAHYPVIEIRNTVNKLREKLEKHNYMPTYFATKYEEVKKEILSKLFYNYPLRNNNLRIGIFGTGMLCEKFLVLYQKYIGDIRAQLIFIDSFKESGGRYNGFPLYNLQDIIKIKNDIILIASVRCKEEMLESITAILPKETKILIIPDYLQDFN